MSGKKCYYNHTDIYFDRDLQAIRFFAIGDRKDGVCLQLHGQVSRQPKRCSSAMLEQKGREFRCVLSAENRMTYSE